MPYNVGSIMDQDQDTPVNELPVEDLSTLTPEQFAELREQAAKAAEYWQRILVQAADFDNYKKRAARERQDAIAYANESLLQKLIPILDNFEMALAAAANDAAAKS